MQRCCGCRHGLLVPACDDSCDARSGSANLARAATGDRYRPHEAPFSGCRVNGCASREPATDATAKPQVFLLPTHADYARGPKREGCDGSEKERRPNARPMRAKFIAHVCVVDGCGE